MSLSNIIRNLTSNEFFRFCIVGGICTLIDAGIFYSVRLFAVYQVALVSGYVLSLVVNYFLTVLWTFKTKPSALNAVAVVGAHLFNLFVVRMGLMHCFTIGLHINDRIAYVPTLIISIITNYLIIKFLIKKIQYERTEKKGFGPGSVL